MTPIGVPEKAAAAPLRSLLETRHSCRGFRPTPVPAATVREILAMAQRAPSWCNSQPWQVIVTSGRETEAFRTFLTQRVTESSGAYDIAPPQRHDGVYGERRRSSGFALYDSVGVRRDDVAGRRRQAFENFRFFGAPHVAIVTSEAALGSYGYLDCGGYLSTFLLAAASLGVATIAQAAIATYSDAVREYFGLPHTRHVVCGVSFGYADPGHPANGFRTDRADVEEVAELHGF
ncbi:nitroreductase [Streptomyces mirabilis]|uniref:nitroreductase n=1 Tax=Streptomyces mirabilis TaxID=68239 RepID=UPI0033B356DD